MSEGESGRMLKDMCLLMTWASFRPTFLGVYHVFFSVRSWILCKLYYSIFVSRRSPFIHPMVNAVAHPPTFRVFSLALAVNMLFAISSKGQSCKYHKNCRFCMERVDGKQFRFRRPEVLSFVERTPGVWRSFSWISIHKIQYYIKPTKYRRYHKGKRGSC